MQKPKKKAVEPNPLDDAVLAEKAAAILAAYTKSVEGHLDAGRLLKEVKDANYAAFRRMLANNLKWGRSQAYRLMDAYVHFEGCPNLGQFDISAIYILSTKKCPKKAREAAKKVAAKGEYVSYRLARTLVAKELAKLGGEGEKPTPAPFRDIEVANGALVKVRVPAGDLNAVEAALLEALEHIRATIQAAK
ncbi:MAG: hypothetical protein LC104_16770 [Bacteroidales bacterium]|nr:hypothetical protein [Bacteroidales bacterium]